MSAERQVEDHKRRGVGANESSVYEQRWGVSRRIVQLRPHLWRQLAPRLSGTRVLEIGPGLRPTAPVREGFFVETSQAAVRALRGAGAKVVRSAGALPFRDDSFDAVMGFEVLEHVEEDVALLLEISRVLKPGGLVLVSVPLYRELWTVTDDACAHVRRYEPSELWEKLRDAGIEPRRYHLQRGRPRPGLAKVGQAACSAMPAASNYWLQTVVFPLQSVWQAAAGRYRWSDANGSLPSGGSGVTVVATANGARRA